MWNKPLNALEAPQLALCRLLCLLPDALAFTGGLVLSDNAAFSYFASVSGLDLQKCRFRMR